MAENSDIQWTHHTFNPWIGCTKVSPACDNCYAEAQDIRFNKGQRWGPHANRTRTKTWGDPVKWNRKAEAKGTRYRVFCASLADVFDNHQSIQDEWRADLWQLIRATPNLDWLLLTKRPQNIRKYAPWSVFPENVWIGTTVENQKTADQRIPHLLEVPAKIRFLSCEPLLGSLDLTPFLWGRAVPCHGCPKDIDCGCGFFPRGAIDGEPALHWIITGGESGPQSRKVNADWFRSLRDQCTEAGVPFLFKQWEGRNQREIKAKGRLLDGVLHDSYPLRSAA